MAEMTPQQPPMQPNMGGNQPNPGMPQGQPDPQAGQKALASLPPEDRQKAEGITTGVRAILASKAGDKVIAVAKEGIEQMATSIVSIVTVLIQKMKLPPDDIPLAILAAGLELYGFLVQKKLMQESPDALRTTIAMAMAQLSGAIGGPPDQEDIQALNQVIDGLGDEVMAALQMTGGAQPPGQPPGPPQGQPQPQPPQGGGMIPGV